MYLVKVGVELSRELMLGWTIMGFVVETLMFRFVPLMFRCNLWTTRMWSFLLSRSIHNLIENLKLIIFDTLARSIVGEDENSAEGMGKVVAEMDYLRRGYGCSTMVVHHTGLNNKNRARGSSVISAAMDTEIGIEKKPDSMVAKLTCTKMKDGEEFSPIAVTLEGSKERTKDGKPATLVSVLGGHVPVEDPLHALARNKNGRRLLEFMVEERQLGESYKQLRQFKYYPGWKFRQDNKEA